MIHAVAVPFRLLHTSDWHLGRTLHAVSLLEDQDAFLAFLLDLLENDPHDALIVAGDVFDRSVPTEEAVARLSTFLAALRTRLPALPVVVIAGNHDSATRLAFGSELLASMQLHVRGGTAGIETPVRLVGRDGTRAEIWPVPFLHAGALEAQREGERFKLTTQVDALDEALARIARAHDAAQAQVLVSHCFARGGLVSDSERTIVGTASEIDAAAFARFDYVALGHLHRAQALSENVRYSGSPIAYSFSEAGDLKMVLSVSVERGERARVREIPTPVLRPMVILRGTFEALLGDPAHAVHEDSYVRIELTEAPTAIEPMARLRARFTRLLDLRVHTSERAEARQHARDAQRERKDVEADFLDFEAMLRGQAPDEAIVAAFRAARATVSEEPS